MAVVQRSLGDITNSVNQLSICTPSKSQNLNSEGTVQIHQKDSSSPFCSNFRHRNGSSFDTEESLLTASESDAFTEDDGENNDITNSERENVENGNVSAMTCTSKPKNRAPPPIFFGTPSKAEHDRRHKYQARLRTRRLLRKDSIELTRRKSGGWEGHETITDRTVQGTEQDSSASDEEVEAEENSRSGDLQDEADEVSNIDRFHDNRKKDGGVPTLDLDEEQNMASLEVLEDEEERSSDDQRGAFSEGVRKEGEAVVDDCKVKEDAVGNVPFTLADGNRNKETFVEKQMNSSTAEASFMPSSQYVSNSIAETPEDDPDATEEADWFGIKSGSRKLSISQRLSPPSLPSTPTRQKDVNSSLDKNRISLAPSEADSSPGIALAPYPFSSRPSPMTYAASRGKVSPFVNSPALSYLSMFSPQVDRENVGHVSQHPSASRSGPVLRESPRKSNAANTLYSPTKVEVRSKLAAWADAKVKTPQSPEKMEFDAMRLSSIQPESFSPTIKPSVSHATYDLLDIAAQIPLPLSPEKIQKASASSLAKSAQISDRTPSQTLQRTSPIRSDVSLRTSRLPVPAISKLPRPFKLSVAKSHGQSQQKLGTGLEQSQGLTQKTSINGERGSAKRSLASHTSSVGRSYPSIGHNESKTPRNIDTSINGKRLLSNHSSHSTSSSSSPVKRAVKSNAPIVRDARLIAGRNAKPSSSNVKEAIDNLVTEEKEDATKPPDDPKIAAMNVSKAGSVGGARRVMRGATATLEGGKEGQDKRADNSNVRAATSDDAVKTNYKRRLGMREAAPIAQSTTTKEKNPTQARSMRRINDIIRKVDSSLSSPSRQLENAVVLENVSRQIVKDEQPVDDKQDHRAAMGEGQLDQESTTRLGAKSSSSSSPSKSTSLPFKAATLMLSSTAKSTSAPRPIPISSMELSRLTSLHTRCNEIGVAQLELVIIRKQGELRPASPSSKFRKNAETSSSASTLTESQRKTREAQSKQARKDRAAQRAERLSGSNTFDSFGCMEQEEESIPQTHRLAAGEEEIYSTPPRRISLKKAVRWHKALFAGPSDDLSNRNKTRSTDPTSFHGVNLPKPIKSCLANSGQATSLDRFGNVPQAGKPLDSQQVKRKKIIITKIVYDDDESEL